MSDTEELNAWEREMVERLVANISDAKVISATRSKTERDAVHIDVVAQTPIRFDVLTLTIDANKGSAEVTVGAQEKK